VKSALSKIEDLLSSVKPKIEKKTLTFPKPAYVMFKPVISDMELNFTVAVALQECLHKATFSGRTIEIVLGDLLSQDVDCIVNAANNSTIRLVVF
jgi:hypothetical protein